MAANPVAAWIVPLKGHLFDLEDLPHHTVGSPVSVVHRDDAWYLHIPSDEIGHGYEPILPTARQYIALLNGICAMELQGVQPLELADGEFYAIDGHGQIVNTVVRVDTPVVRFKAGQPKRTANGTAGPNGTQGTFTPLLQEARAVPAKADALAIVGRSSVKWSDLYLVFALVEAGVGRRMITQRWISRLDADLFIRTVQAHTTLGGNSRRRTLGDDTASLMTLPVALGLMRRLVARWLADTARPGA